MRLLVSLLALSAVIHVLAIYLLPSFGAVSKKADEKPPVYTEISRIDVPRPKPRPPEKEVKTKPASRPSETTPKPSEKVPAPAAPDFIPAGADEPLVLPDIVVPKSSTVTKPEIAVPDVIGVPERKNPPVPKGPSVDKELASLEARRGEAEAQSRAVNEEARKTGPSSLSGQIYNFDVMPSNNRSVSYAPPEPEFDLENDAKVTLKFSIDKNGNTSDIIFITHSSDYVEKIAYGYISRMRFDAVIQDGKDTAQITITFKVRK